MQSKKIVSHVRNHKSAQNNSFDSEESKELPPSIAILFSAHEFLGKYRIKKLRNIK